MNPPYKISVSDLLHMACVYAVQDRLGFIQAHAHMPDDPALAEARAYLSALRIYMRRRWPEPDTPPGELVPFDQVAARLLG